MKSAGYPTFATFSFVTPFNSERVSYQNGKKRLAASVKDDDSLKQGLLLETFEKGVSYPVVHYSPLQPFTTFDRFGKHGLTNYNNEYIIDQGVYRELDCIRADLFGTPLDDLLTIDQGETPKPSWRKFYLMLGFKHLPVLTFTNVVENYWKDWTGARYLFLNMPSEFGLSRLTFYRREDPDDNDVGLFLYVVLAECVHITERDERPLLDFVQRMRSERMPPYLALYEESESQQRGAAFPLEPLWFRHRRMLPRNRGIGRQRSHSGGSLGTASPDNLPSPTGFSPTGVEPTGPWSPVSFFRSTIGTVDF